jgi:hypothetical protein
MGVRLSILSIFSTAFYSICTTTAPAVKGRKATCMFKIIPSLYFFNNRRNRILDAITKALKEL